MLNFSIVSYKPIIALFQSGLKHIGLLSHQYWVRFSVFFGTWVRTFKLSEWSTLLVL